MATPGEETKKLARDVGQRSVGQLEAGLARIMGETGANNRWLLGALVLLNGGGIAVAAYDGWLIPPAMENAVSLFVIGAALAVLAALAGALSALLLSRQIGAAIALWAQVAAEGELSDAAVKAAGKVRQTGLFSSLAVLGLGFLALVLFVGGAWTPAGRHSPSEEQLPDLGVVPAEPGNVAAPSATPAESVKTPTPTPTATPAPAVPPESKPVPEAKAPPPEPRGTPRPTPPRANQATQAPSSAPAATPPAAPGIVQQIAAQPSGN